MQARCMKPFARSMGFAVTVAMIMICCFSSNIEASPHPQPRGE